MSTFVSVGNAHQPFSRLVAAVADISEFLPQPVVIQHGYTPFVSDHCEAIPFLEMSEFQERIAFSTLLILHAGVGGILSALKCGKIPIIVPRRADLGEHIDNHQVDLGRALAGTGRVVVIEDVANLEIATKHAVSKQTGQRAKQCASRSCAMPFRSPIRACR
jgi:UDP-N-acetylglucosamine transferase subunit ALG13